LELLSRPNGNGISAGWESALMFANSERGTTQLGNHIRLWRPGKLSDKKLFMRN